MTDPTAPGAPVDPDRQVAPYGTWPSPVSAADLATASTTYEDLGVDGDTVFWLQSDAAEDGRLAVVRHDDGGRRSISPEGFSARTRAYEYGGGALGVGHGTVLACSWDDQRVHRIHDGRTEPVTPEPRTPAGIRWSGMAVLPGGEGFVAVRETHGEDRPRCNRNIHGVEEAVNEVVAVDLTTGAQSVLVSGPDFVGGPWLSPDGARMAWVQWDHPDMSWDAAELWVADLTTTGSAVTASGHRHIAGGAGADGRDPSPDRPHGAAQRSAVCDAHWQDEGTLLFCDDPDGWWNVHRWDGERVTRLQEEPVESGFPRWVNRTGRLTTLGGRIHVATESDGTSHVRTIGPEGTTWPEVDGIAAISHLAGTTSSLIMIAGGPTVPTGVWRVDAADGTAVRLSAEEAHPTAAAVPEAITFPTPDGQTAHALYYPPVSATHRGPPDQRPPLVVLSHGGPTAAARATLNTTAQYWTSRGLAVVDVNYRGSTGYGRAYRDALRGNWGVHDVTDCVAAATHLAARGDADPDRLIIEGGSAGGYTTLLALCTTDVFAAGGSLFGVADLRALATDTHKLESRYLDSLIGPWPAAEQTYVDRSPISHVAELSTPMIVLQGDEDAVVPPAQAEMIVAALRQRGIAHAYLLFEGEQHGFRKAPHIIRAIEARLAFYGRILGFEPDDDIPLPEFRPAVDAG